MPDTREIRTVGDLVDSLPEPKAPLASRSDMTYQCSDSLDALFAALARAQGEIRNAAKDALNPHFKARYADLASIADACRAPLAKNGISVVQMPTNGGNAIKVTTLLGHASGQWMSSTISVSQTKLDPQAIGSAITYLRRYSLAAMTGVAPGDDDDGEAAMGRNGAAKVEPSASVTPAQKSELIDMMKKIGPEVTAPFLGYYAVEYVDDLPAEKFAGAKAMLDKKLKAKLAKTAPAETAQ